MRRRPLNREAETSYENCFTDMPESQPQEEENKTREQNRNFWVAIFQGIFGRISFSLSDSTTVLSAFIYKLTASNTLVGLTGSIMSVGWMWPQLLISQSAGTQAPQDAILYPRQGVHTAVWLAITVCTVWIGARNYGLLAGRFYPPLFRWDLVNGRVLRCVHGYYLQND